MEDEVTVKSMIGYVPEEVALFDSLTPRKFFEFIASVRGLKADTVISKLEKLVDAFDVKKYFDSLM